MGGRGRESTLGWFRRNATRLSLASAFQRVLEAYASALS